MYRVIVLGSSLLFLSLQAVTAEETGLANIDSFPCDQLSQVMTRANEDDAKAQVQLTKAYLSGTCVEKNEQEGAKWLVRAANLGYPVAEGGLAAFLAKTGDNVEAAKMARLAAEQGDPIGEFVLALLLEHGWGIPQDNSEAAKWARRSAEQNNSGGQTIIGYLYEQGAGGLMRNLVEADRWYILAARHFKKSAPSPSLIEMQEHVESQMSVEEIREAHKRADIWVNAQK